MNGIYIMFAALSFNERDALPGPARESLGHHLNP